MKAGKIFWGIILVYVGVLILLSNFNVIDFSWRVFWKFWPVLLIIWGIDILISKENNKKAAVLVGLITCIGLGVLTYFGLKENLNNYHVGWEETYDDHRRIENKEGHRIFTEDYSSNIKAGKISIVGGAGNFKVKNTTDKLLEARVGNESLHYMLKRLDADSSVNLSFQANEKGISFPKGKVHDTKILLNANPIWDIDVKLGAADVELDLSTLKVKNLTFSGGAADVEIKLGDLYHEQNVVVETGVSSVEIKVPKGVGCRIVNQSGLSSKSFESFIDKGSGVYETSNYESESANKINLILKTGISDLRVKTY